MLVNDVSKEEEEEEKKKPALMCSIRWLLWCKYSHDGKFQTANNLTTGSKTSLDI